MKLSEVEQKILYILITNAGASASTISRMVGCRVHTVQVATQKFIEAGLIARRVMIDVFRLGLSRHALYISLSSEGQVQRDRIARYLEDCSHISVVLDVGGEYDFFVTFVGRNAADLAQFNLQLSKLFGMPFVKKDLAVTVKHAVFGEKSLFENPKVWRESFYEVTSDEQVYETDALDERLLYAVSSPLPWTLNSIARSLGVAQSTLDYRLKRLKQLGIICGDLYEVNGEMLGLNNFVVLVAMKGLSDEIHQRMYNMVKGHRFVAHFSHEIGHWDYMLGISARKPQEVGEFVDLLHHTFGRHIATIKYFPMLRARKVRDYPMG